MGAVYKNGRWKDRGRLGPRLQLREHANSSDRVDRAHPIHAQDGRLWVESAGWLAKCSKHSVLIRVAMA